ncbi:conserved hypothetical protein [Candidatus Caldarchaeum subterraneum]|uniref:Helicase HerA central domain-containing protein n=1 Tax=Caldiarchaeum subterraneum TaxID=311458 RepID=E6N6E2_CALS0|nr:conserved hypothetical protein [Candidatus Caldarchaeum subterraneum]BAJ49493.1 conserved hypothetical protein [Candidatus Caldarchaeum subterraneum]BAJ50711.1 conserved hypothetical protein [Candidatus Caldarchaeum subterraneum]
MAGVDWSGVKLEQIGLVASPSGENGAMCILQDGMETRVTTETLVLIENRNGNKLLAVCRSGLGSNDSLKTNVYNPGVAYAKTGKGPSTAKEFFGYQLVVIGDVTDGSIKPNRLIIAPASKVYRFDEGFNPMQLLGGTGLTLGYYATGTPTWKIPVLKEYITHHIGVFGVTGSGKSYLTRYQLIPLLRQSGFDVLIFDWKGSDYAPYYSDVINMDDILLDDESILSFLLERLNYFGGGGSAEKLAEYLDQVITEGRWRGKTAAEALETITNELYRIISEDNTDKSGKPSHWANIYMRKAQRYLSKLDEDDVKPLLGTLTAEEIVEKLREKHLIVIDLSYGSKEQKLSIFLSIVGYLKRLMEEKNRLNIALVVDEAPQYCPWNPKGIEEEATRAIMSIAALGRSYGLSITLISQGIAGEIGLNAAVRRNLNTLFIGKIHPLDVPEADKFFATALVDPSSLLRLPEGHFYMIGKMNPSPVPLLLTFEIPEEEKTVGRR